MNRGCLITVAIFGGAIFVLIVLAIGVPMVMFDVVRSAPKVPTSTFLTDHTVAAFRIDPNQKELISILNATGARFDWFFPHEAGAVVDLDASRKTRTLTLAGSPKHLGPLFLLLFNDDEMFHPEELEIPGIDHWMTRKLTREKGALILRGTGSVTPEAEALVAASWPERGPRKAAVLEGNHSIELAIENRGGEAVLALQPLVEEEQPAEADKPQPSSDASVPDRPAGDMKVEAESAGAESNSAAVSAEKDEADEPAESSPDAAGLLHVVNAIRLSGDFTGDDAFTFTTVLECKDSAGVESVKTVLDGIREEIQTAAKEEELTAECRVAVSGTNVTHTCVLTGIRPRITKWIRENQR